MSNIVLKAENISKQYRLGVTGSGTLRDDLARSWAKLRGKEDPTLKIGQSNTLDTIDGDYVWALQDINFEVKQGEVLGIIGKNGAGKSTLLKLLSKVTGPTTGSIKTKGRIAALLEVGTGMHPELTGRENIFLNGAILGMTKAEVRRKLDEIIDFAGIAKYVDTPIKRYSSGMSVRLGFAVAAFLEPEILIVDEVLAVGDAEFQKKAIGKMQDVSSGEGRTVLFVSHNMASISQLCNRGIFMKNGGINYSGDVLKTIQLYLNHNENRGNENYNIFEDESVRNGPCKFSRMTSLSVINDAGLESDSFEMGDKLCLIFGFEIKTDTSNVELGFKFISQTNQKIATYLSSWEGLLQGYKKGHYYMKCEIDSINLFPGEYGITPWIRQAKSGVDDQIQNVSTIKIIWKDITGFRPNFEGTGELGTFQRSNWQLQ